MVIVKLVGIVDECLCQSLECGKFVPLLGGLGYQHIHFACLLFAYGLFHSSPQGVEVDGVDRGVVGSQRYGLGTVVGVETVASMLEVEAVGVETCCSVAIVVAGFVWLALCVTEADFVAVIPFPVVQRVEIAVAVVGSPVKFAAVVGEVLQKRIPARHIVVAARLAQCGEVMPFFLAGFFLPCRHKSVGVFYG